MAGYSGTPLPKKLGIKPGHRLWMTGDASAVFAMMLQPLPDEIEIADGDAAGTYDIIIYFTKSRSELKSAFGKLKRRLEDDGGLWIGWPKKAAGVPTDLTEDVVREIGLATGLVDNKVCAIDDTWSGLRFVVRLADRAKKRRK